MSANLTDQAIKHLVERRWPMLPSRGAQKKPCVGWKVFQEQLPTTEQIREWALEFKPSRWGVVTGRLADIVVADFDGDEGRALMKKWGIQPHLQTGSGGFHCYLQHPGWHVPTLNAKSGKLSWPWPGLDIRGDGGFAILLGSNSNGPYVQLRDLVPESFDALPQEVRAFLRCHSEPENVTPSPASGPSPTCGRRVDAEKIIRKAMAIALREGRNNAGIWLACQLRDNGYNYGEAQATMRDYRAGVSSSNTKGKREPYTVREMKASLEEAYSKPARQPWERRKMTQPPPRSGAAPGGKQFPGNEEGAHGDGADDPVIVDIYVDHTSEPLVDHTGEPLPAWAYARVPREVVCDSNLKFLDVRVYSVLSGDVWQGTTATIGTRLIADYLQASRRLVIESLCRLEQRGHIAKARRRRGKRAMYVLLSPVFGQKQRHGAEEKAMGPSGPRLVSVPKKENARALRSYPAGFRARSKQ
jgi:hypothetical protein